MNTSLGNLSAQTFLQTNPIINKLIVAIIIFFVGLIIGKVLGKLAEQILREFRVDKTVKDKIGVRTSLQKLVGNIISYSIYFVFFIIALNYVGITVLLLNILSIVVILVLFISAILGIKDAVPNMMAYRHVQKNIKEGDSIVIKSVAGIVQEITIFSTTVQTKVGDEIIIPNSLFLKETNIKRAKKETKKEKENKEKNKKHTENKSKKTNRKTNRNTNRKNKGK